MSGYPQYPTPYGAGSSPYPNYPPAGAYQAPPPPIPVYGNSQPYGAPPLVNHGHFPASPYGGNQMPSGGYPSHQPSVAGQMYAAPSPQYGGQMNAQYQAPYPQQAPVPSHGLYPALSSQAAPSNYAQPAYQQSNYPQEQQSILMASLENYQGTIFPAANFNPDGDCQALSQAMRGAGTNERALIDIIVNRSNSQRQQIKAHYRASFGHDLIKQLSGELSGHFKETINALFDAPAYYDAWSLHQALNASKEGTLREILLTRTNSEIRAIVDAYRQTYRKELEKEVKNRVGGTDFKRMLISALQANRDELNPSQIQQARQMGIESIIDRHAALRDAESLYKAGAGKWGTDEKTFNAIFSQRSYYHLRAVFEEYKKKHGQDIAQVIRSEFSGDAKDAYLVLVTCIQDRPSFFAERAHKAISGLGTKDSSLIRVIVTRSEIDLEQVKQRYQQMYHKSLAQDVSGDTSGDYKRLLLAIVK